MVYGRCVVLERYIPTSWSNTKFWLTPILPTRSRLVLLLLVRPLRLSLGPGLYARIPNRTSDCKCGSSLMIAICLPRYSIQDRSRNLTGIVEPGNNTTPYNSKIGKSRNLRLILPLCGAGWWCADETTRGWGVTRYEWSRGSASVSSSSSSVEEEFCCSEELLVSSSIIICITVTPIPLSILPLCRYDNVALCYYTVLCFLRSYLPPQNCNPRGAFPPPGMSHHSQTPHLCPLTLHLKLMPHALHFDERYLRNSKK